MHKCVRCSRVAASLQEINDGCPCGSKVFVFNKDSAGIAGELQNGADAAGALLAGGRQEGEKTVVLGELKPGASPEAGAPESAGGKMPESYHARATFTSEDVENIKVLTEGVFVLSLQSLNKDPVVLKDEDGIYYVKIPMRDGHFERHKGNGRKLDADSGDGAGKE